MLYARDPECVGNMSRGAQDSDQGTLAGGTYSGITDTSRMYPQLRIRRIEYAHRKDETNTPSHRSSGITNEEEERPRLRRTKMPSAKVLERRERQRALNERIRDNYFDRINGNFFPKEQIEE